MNKHEQTVKIIEALLNEALQPVFLSVVNQSHLHAKHKEAKKHPRAGHFQVTIQSSALDRISPVEQHRVIYKALDSIMPESIHALSIKVKPA